MLFISIGTYPKSGSSGGGCQGMGQDSRARRTEFAISTWLLSVIVPSFVKTASRRRWFPRILVQRVV
jgi:hypothetical protein